MPIKDQYSELLKMTSPCEKLIRRDIARTYPEHEFFKEKDSLGQEVLFNVMKVSFFCGGALIRHTRFSFVADLQLWVSVLKHVASRPPPHRRILWLTGRLAIVKGARSSWDCCSCRCNNYILTTHTHTYRLVTSQDVNMCKERIT